jgi:hypothetical protein
VGPEHLPSHVDLMVAVKSYLTMFMYVFTGEHVEYSNMYFATKVQVDFM